MRGNTGAALVAAAIMLMPLAGRADDPKDVIDYRQHIMKTLNEQSAALGQILSMAAPNDDVITHIDALAQAASMGLKAFTPKAEGGEAKPDVWNNWPDFSKRMNDFAAKTAEMSKMAHESGPDAALGMVIDALSCKSCHDVYRSQKK